MNERAAAPMWPDGLTSLAGELNGRIVIPGDPRWDDARRPWNLAVDQRPVAVAQVETADDVVSVLRAARRAGLRVAPQGTGHAAATLGDLAGTILLRTDRMRAVTVDAAARIVRADAGVTWAEVTATLAPHGLVGLAGSAGDVGVVGYLLGGGYSWLARQYGLGSSSVTAIELVTGDGHVLRIDADHEPELFWAMRGGCGNAAIVTAVEFRAFPLAEVYAGALLYPIERAREVLAEYTGWVRDLPDEASTCARLLRLPPIAEMPEALRGKKCVGIDGALDLPTGEAEALVAPLRALGPEIDTFTTMPGSALGGIHMDPPHPAPGFSDGMTLRALPPEAIDALVTVAGPDAESPLLAVDLRHLGGAAGRPDPAGGAIDHLPGEFLLSAVGITPVPEAMAPVTAAIDGVKSALRPWQSDRDYPNFCESAGGAERFYGAEVAARLAAIGRRYDSDGLVRAGHGW